MPSTRNIMGTLLIAMALGTASVCGQNQRDQREDAVYNRMATIKGRVMILNHPTLGKTPANNRETIIFQRKDCKRCLIEAITDENGYYQVRVSQGWYKVIIRYGSREGELKDVLARNQPRYVEAKSPINATEFDINIVLPK